MLLPPARVCYCRPSKSSRSQRRLLFHLHGTDYEGSEALAVDELLQVDGFERRTRCAGTDRIGGLVGTHAEHRRSGCATRRELTRRLDPPELRPPHPASPPKILKKSDNFIFDLGRIIHPGAIPLDSGDNKLIEKQGYGLVRLSRK
jgi:hypothetical protein